MNKSATNIIVYALEVLAIFSLAVVVALPGSAKAGYYYNESGNGYNGQPNPNNQVNPIPVIYSVTPNSIDLNSIAGNMAVVLNGANFVPGSMAEFNSTYRPTNYNTANQLTVILSASDFQKIGSNVITVFNPMPAGGNSNGVFFTVKAAIIPQPQNINTETNATPVVSSVSATTPKVAKTIKETTPLKSSESLTANAIFSTDGFLPSNFIQWVIALILIVLLILIGRKAYGSEKYQAKPLKHA